MLWETSKNERKTGLQNLRNQKIGLQYSRKIGKCFVNSEKKFREFREIRNSSAKFKDKNKKLLRKTRKTEILFCDTRKLVGVIREIQKLVHRITHRLEIRDYYTMVEFEKPLFLDPKTMEKLKNFFSNLETLKKALRKPKDPKISSRNTRNQKPLSVKLMNLLLKYLF